MEQTPAKNIITDTIFLLGPTGIGKSKLSLILAEKFNYEIVNSDVFSLYKGADIMTAKPDLLERSKIKHHLIDILDLNQIEFNVIQYKNLYLDLIEDLSSKKITPLIVGGTNYYVEEILFEKIENSEKELDIKDNNLNLKSSQLYKDTETEINKIKNMFENEEDSNRNIKKFIDDLDSNSLIQLLKICDPKYSTFLHDNDLRRIKNCIIYYFLKGKPKSEKILKESKKLRFNQTKVIFLQPKNLNDLFQKIDLRLNDMVIQGLNEILCIFNLLESNLMFDKGILQAIGYKEFDPFWKELQGNLEINNLIISILSKNDLTQSEKNKEILNIIESNQKLFGVFKSCVEKVGINTKNYAKSQLKFINKKIIPFIPKENLLIVEKNDQSFQENFLQIVDFIELNNIINENTSEVVTKPVILENWQKHMCNKCNKEFNGDHAYKIHLKSRKHKNYKGNREIKI